MKGTEHGRRTPVIVVSSVYKGRKYRSQAIHHHGADEYLEKPVTPEKLLETVDRLLDGRAPQPVAAAAATSTAAEPAATAAPQPSPAPPQAATP